MSEQKGGSLHLKQSSSSSPPNIKPEAKSFAGLAGTEDSASQAGDRFMDVLPYDDDGRLLTGGEVASIRDMCLNSRLPQFAKSAFGTVCRRMARTSPSQFDCDNDDKQQRRPKCVNQILKS
jgi:hypothetical protein